MSTSLADSIKRLFSTLPSRVKIQGRYIGAGEPVFVIAEIGNNHNGDFDLAMKSIDASREAGADAVKFQKRDIDQLLSKEMKEMPYDNPRSFGKTYAEHRRNQELSIEQYKKLKDHAESLGLVFFATPFDHHSADELESIGVHAYKIASFDVTNLPLLEYVAKKNMPILLSTGLSTLAEIDAAVETILSHNNRLIVNHCTSIYPTPDENVDLNVMTLLKNRYEPLPVGYSGHELDTLPTVTSIALGASTVERHLTLDKKMKGSDHHMSIEPAQFKQMVDDIRRVEVFMGSHEKRIHEEEIPVRKKLNKSIVAKHTIKKGQKIQRDDLVLKSPGSGIEPALLHDLIGRIAEYDIPEDTMLPQQALQWSHR